RVESPTQAFVELLGWLDVGYGNDLDLELHLDSRSAGARLLLFFHAVACLTHLIPLLLIVQKLDETDRSHPRFHNRRSVGSAGVSALTADISVKSDQN